LPTLRFRPIVCWARRRRLECGHARSQPGSRRRLSLSHFGHAREDIVNWLNTRAGIAKRSDPVVRDKVAEMWIEAQVLPSDDDAKPVVVMPAGDFSYEGSAEKVWAPEHGVRATEPTARLSVARALLSSSFAAVEQGIFAHNMLGAFQSTVNHGSARPCATRSPAGTGNAAPVR